ncbi:MAG TPA: hypothetical protein VFU15_08870, partial [Bacteroidia bacterium]|nr:hypothetical protein [Bacteroidia bacterium]
DQSNSKGDKSLTGSWEEKGSDDYEWKVTLDDNMYRIEKTNTKDGGDPTVYKGYLSDVGGSTWMNVYELDDYSSSSDRKYYIYKVEKKGDDADRVKMRAMTDNVTEEFETSADLKAFIKKYMDLSFFYNKDDEKTFYKND